MTPTGQDRPAPPAQRPQVADGHRRVLVAHPGSEMYGSDRVLLESVIGMVRAGWNVIVTVPQDGPLVTAITAAGATAKIAPTLVLRKRLLHPLRWPALIGGAIGAWASGWRLISEFRPDVIYVNTVTLPVMPALARLRGIPHLTHVHEAERAAPWAVKYSLYLPSARADSVVVNSEYSRGVIADVHPKLAARSTLIYNGVPSPEDVPAPRDRLDGPVRLLFVGRLSPRKGPDVVVEAVGRIRETGRAVELVIAGSAFAGYEWYRAELEATVAALGLGAHVTFAGFRDDIWPLIAAADIVVVPSRQDEPFGNTAVEGILGARPVIASDTSGLREAVHGFSSARLVSAGDVGALVAAVLASIGGWEELRHEAIRAARSARERYAPARYRSDLVAEMSRITRAVTRG